MTATLRKVDGEGRVVLPAAFVGQTVSVSELDGGELRIKVVRPLRRRPTLESLMARVTDENCHEEIDFGRPVGGEEL